MTQPGERERLVAALRELAEADEEELFIGQAAILTKEDTYTWHAADLLEADGVELEALRERAEEAEGAMHLAQSAMDDYFNSRVAKHNAALDAGKEPWLAVGWVNPGDDDPSRDPSATGSPCPASKA